MLRAIKPFAGPTMLVALEVGLSMSGLNSPFWGGVIAGAAVFWYALALFSNKALLRRIPWILEWMPFLDPTGGFATSEQLTGKFIQGLTFHISAISHNGEIHERTFDDCTIYGPAVLYLQGISNVNFCSFDRPPDQVFVAVTHVPAGAVTAESCTFRRCRMTRITFVGSDCVVRQWKETGCSGTT